MKRLLKLKNRFHIILDRQNYLSPATPADIESLINCIKPNKTISPKTIPTKILKEFKTELSEPLSD